MKDTLKTVLFFGGCVVGFQIIPLAISYLVRYILGE